MVAVVKPLAPLLARLVIGHAFMQTGIGKWENFHDTVEFFASLGLPAPAANAAFTASLEVVGGAALILGIGTNLFAALLSSTMVVALLTADRANFIGAITGSGDQSLTDILPLMFPRTPHLAGSVGAQPHRRDSRRPQAAVRAAS